MGSKIEERYSTIASEYFDKKVEREKKHETNIKNLRNQSLLQMWLVYNLANKEHR